MDSHKNNFFKKKESIDDLDKQLEFYNQTLNQFEILNHNYILKINNLQKSNNDLKNEISDLNKKISNLKEENIQITKMNDSVKEDIPSLKNNPQNASKEDENKLNIPPVSNENLKKGVTVLVPTYKAENFVLKFLDSMKKQTLDYELFEVLFVINGVRDNTENLINDFVKDNPQINIKVIESEPGATTARNAGINILDREYVTFIDVDDFISPRYLEVTYNCAKPNRIVIGNYYDIDENTGELSETYFTNSLSKFKGIIDPYSVAQGALLIATNKVMPTKYVKTIKFNTNLKSGDDHEYFCRLYSQYDFEFYFVGADSDAVYYRLVVSNSVSRQPTSFDFNVIQRLDVIKEVEFILDNIKNFKMRKLLDLTINSSQMTFLIRYLDEFPKEYKNVINEIDKYNLKYFNYTIFHEKVINSLNKSIIDSKNELNNIKKINSDILKQNDDLKKHNNELLNSVSEMDVLKNENENLIIQNNKLKEINNQLINSNSWKLTKPLRKIRNRK